jgi:peptidyl-prolyl cis-trans isomerase D
MLSTIRDRATGWIAGIIIGLLIISFAVWGVSFYSGQSGGINVALVNDTEISFQSFQRSFAQLRKRMQSIMGDSLSLEEEALIKNQTLQKLIESELVNQLVVDSNLNITNERLVESIKNIEVFRDDTGFDRTKYERSISNIGMPPVVFEAQLRMDLLSEQLQAGFAETTFILASELENILRLESQSRDITYTILGLPSFIEDGEISKFEVEEYYQANPMLFTSDEQVKIEYIELSVKELAKDIDTDEENLRTFYNDNKDDYDIVEQRSVQKLFVRIDEKATDEIKAGAKVVITSALDLVNQGKDFEEIVEESTDEAGILEYSEHSFMSKGIMEKEIDEFLFSSDEGTASGVIETEKGFNIVKVVEIRGGPKNRFEKFAEKVEQDYKTKQAELHFFELADQLTTVAYENSDNLETASETIDKDIIVTEYFNRTDELEGILSKPAIISKSFDPELISTGNNSDAIELSDDHIVVLRVLDYKKPYIKPLDDVRTEVIASVRLEHAKEKINETGDEIIAQLKSGVAPNDVTSHSDVEWVTAEKVKRDDVSVNRAILRSTFESGKPTDKAVITSQRLGSGDYAIIIISNAHDEIQDVNEEQKESTDLRLRRILSTSEWQDLLRDVRKNSDIRVFNENI